MPKLAVLLAIAWHADARDLFAPAAQPVTTLPMGAVAPPPALASPYAEYAPVDYAQPVQSGASLWRYAATGAVLVSVAAAVSGLQRPRPVAELDLESANGAVRVAMLFSSGKSSKPAAKKKAAARKPAPKAKKPAVRAKPVASKKKGKTTSRPAATDDFFRHDGTKGFVGDTATDRITRSVVPNSYVFRSGKVASVRSKLIGLFGNYANTK
jgi:hypothetical protein